MIQKPKGTYDVYGEKGNQILYIENLVKSLMEKYNYEYVKTPLFEASTLFHRGVGETTDIITKETYDFVDKGKRNMTLRPEGTAGVVRSFIENKMYGRTINPTKLWYYGPMYRYERPQSGRYREFVQFGIEVFGSSDPYTDAEVISVPVNLYKLLGLKEVKVNINTLGDSESRKNYQEALINYFKPYLNDLCPDCQERFKKNPLRILDCKVDSNKDYFKDCPKTIDYLNEESKKHFEDVKKYLEAMNIEYIINPNIVRGLDYYNHTVFEVEANVEGFGSQNVLCGGGRYDHLVEQLDGPKTPGVGFALGLERLLNALELEQIESSKNQLDLYVFAIEESDKTYVTSLVQDLRLNGFKVDTDYMNKNIKGNFKQALRLDCKYVIIIGEEERKNKILTIKNNNTKEEYKIKEEELINFLDKKIEE